MAQDSPFLNQLKVQDTILVLKWINNLHSTLSGYISDKTMEKILQAQNRDVQTHDGIGFLINSLFLCNSFFILEAYWANCIYFEYKYDMTYGLNTCLMWHDRLVDSQNLCMLAKNHQNLCKYWWWEKIENDGQLSICCM